VSSYYLQKYSDKLIAEKSFSKSHGWLRIKLCDLSERWRWWSFALLRDKVPVTPIPKISFAENFNESAEPYKVIKRCVDPYDRESFHKLLDWLLYSFGDSSVKALSFDTKHLEANFKLEPFFEEPGDWVGHFYETEIISKSGREKSGFFSTPMSICNLLTSISQPKLTDTVHEPCVGTGRMLLAASNYSIKLSGQDINPDLVKICKINAWLYMPSLIFPITLKEVPKIESRRYQKNSRPMLPANANDRGSLQLSSRFSAMHNQPL